MSHEVDVVVIGGGAAGLNGALVLARSRRSVVVVDSGTPRNAPADGVHGLLALDGVPPVELLRRGRREVTGYGGEVLTGAVASVEAAPAAEGDPRFTLTLTDGRVLRARRLLVATGVHDELPDVPGLARHWGSGVVHCPYCHGWEVRDEAIGVLATGPASAHQVLLWRQLTDDVVYFTRGTGLDPDTRARLAARGVTVVDAAVAGVESDDTGLRGVRLADGRLVERRVLAVATRTIARTVGLEGLGLPTEDLPHDAGRRVLAGPTGATEVPGVWAAGNVTAPTAQVGASAAAGAMAGAHVNADLATADAEAARRAPEPFSAASEAALCARVVGARRHGLEPAT